MKKIIALFLTAVLVMSMSACGQKESSAPEGVDYTLRVGQI